MKSVFLSKKAFLAGALICAAAAGNLAAQTVELPVESPTYKKSSELFTSAADDFISMTDWQGVEFEKWFGFASWADSTPTLGYAQKFGGLYVAAGYRGKLWSGTTAFVSTEREINQNGNYKTWKSYQPLPVFNGSSNPDNKIGVLIGVGNMGFRLLFSSTHQIFSDKDFMAGSTEYASYTTELGAITPQLGWGMTKGLIENGIQPWITLDLGFNRNYTKQETVPAGGSSKGEQVTKSANSFDPVLAFGLGGFTFYKQGAFNAAFDFEYTGTMNLYDNEYSYEKNGKYETGKIQGEFNGGSSYTEKFEMTNNIAPQLKLGWDSEDNRVGLRSKLTLGLDLDPSSSAVMDLNSKYELEKNGSEDKIFTFGFTPSLNVAAQYQLIPGKLTLSIGGYISMNALTITTTETESYTAGKADEHSKETKTVTSFGSSKTGLTAAAAWNITNNFWLEGSTGVDNGDGNVHLVGNLIQFGSILAGLKF